jgi:NAD(P)-dependent dehydrogenase (short-subunit alcohol dehydrogenase family)
MPPDALAVVVGASGGLGMALVAGLRAQWGPGRVLGLARSGTPSLNLLDEASVAEALNGARDTAAQRGLTLRLIIDATGWLHGQGWQPEKSWCQLDAAHLAHNFAINAIGPALLMKHGLPGLPREGPAVFATLSAKVGSIGDNRLGGWYGYRAAKAALNQLVRTAAIELGRTHPQAVCVALHPGTVETALSRPFARAGLDVLAPEAAAQRLLGVIAGLTPERSGRFIDHSGLDLPW